MQVQITRWIDGDTFVGRFTDVDGPERRFRLSNCWAPERGQIGFAETLAFVVMTFGNEAFEVGNDYVHSDRYGRLIVDLRLDFWGSMSTAINEFVESRGYPRGKGWPGNSVA
jgi:endonuclease YncB( thermonuclease family)